MDRKDGSCFECYIDNDDFDKVLSFQSKWCAGWNFDTKSYYAKCIYKIYNNDGTYRKSTMYMHRLIIGAKSREVHVDHKDHNTLDNRKFNLEPKSRSKNAMNRNGKNSNNKSGYRNVSKGGKWWKVQLQVNGKNTILKKFPLDKLEEAGEYAKEMRKKYYGENNKLDR